MGIVALAVAALLATMAVTGGRLLDQWTDSLPDLADKPVSDDPTPVMFTVHPGSSAVTIAEELARAGLIRSALAFRVEAGLRRVGERLAAGEYELRRNMTVREILDALSSGRPPQSVLVTIPEGWRAEEIAQYLEARGVVNAQALLAVVGMGAGAAGPQLPEGASSFEGYLFPDTYDFGPDPTAQSVLRTFVTQFDRSVGQAVRSRAPGRGLSLHELITLASIIEREATHADERAQISAVFHNRLARGMLLQADPTVQYALVPFGALSSGAPFWKGRLDPEDLLIDSPYNTYVAAGLPPGPICNPGVASIQAAANPSDEPWLYFVARGDGSHVFARTLEEHIENIERRAREGGSASRRVL